MYAEIDLDRESPFEPGKPAPPNLFIGRQKTINKILRYTNKVLKGNTQHFFLTGKRRMGKTSVAEYVANNLKEENIIVAYVSNKGNESVEQLTLNIIESLFSQLPKDPIKNKISNWFGEHIESIEIKGNKIKIKADKNLSESFKDNFQDHIKKIYEDELKDLGKKGIFIIIDDINGLSKTKEFVNWYKRFADTIAVSDNYKIPLYMLLAGYPDKFDNLVQQEESFGSIFHHDYIDVLTNKDVSIFFRKMFNQENITISDKALEIMVTFSSGLPLMMQQIGESVFWEIEEDIITEDIAIQGIINAANEIGNKQIRPILNQIKSENYEPILEKLVENRLTSFKRSEVNKLMKNTSENVIKNFLYKMVDLEIFEQIGHKNSGKYKFSNTLYYTYFLIKNIENNEKNTRKNRKK